MSAATLSAGTTSGPGDHPDVALAATGGSILTRGTRTMTRTRTPGRAGRRASRAFALAALVSAFTLGLSSAAYADVTTVTGSAYGERVQVTTALGVGVNSGPTPTVTLPAGGSVTPVTNNLATVTVAGLLSTGVLTVSTQGTTGPGGSVQSSAQVANPVLGLPLAPAVAADAVGSTCTADETGATGTTTVANVRILGAPVTVSTAPNTTVSVAGVGTLFVNEQIVTGTAPSQSITVNALRLQLNAPLGLGTGSITIGQSVCGVVGTGVVVPTGAVGGVLLTGLVAIAFGANQIRRRRGSAEA